MLLVNPSKNNQSTITPVINLLVRHSLQWRHIEFHIPDAWYPIFTPLTDSDSIVENKGGATDSPSTEAPLGLPLIFTSFHLYS